MPKIIYNGKLNDHDVHLLQKGLYVEPLNYPLDMKRAPENGHEYIHRVRLEAASIFPEFRNETEDPLVCSFENFTMFSPKGTSGPKKMSIRDWKVKQASYFSALAVDIKSKKEKLLIQFPKQSFPPVINDKDWCLFALGPELYKEIYNEDSTKVLKVCLPYLSIVLHLEQEDIFVLLEYMKGWFDVIGMNHVLCCWIYALLACLSKPVNSLCATFLENFYDDICVKSKSCMEKNQVHLIMMILKQNFGVKDKISLANLSM